ncbi:MAG: zinc-finger domain-containing protein [Parvibaculales bacterium]
MADQAKPKFRNDQGVPTIRIGVKTFECIGASKPYDHPHVFLDMGKDANIICPYCSTVYEFDDSLQPDETIPAGSLAD